VQMQVLFLGKVTTVEPHAAVFVDNMDVNLSKFFQVVWNSPADRFNGNNNNINTNTTMEDHVQLYPVNEGGACSTLGCEVVSESGGTCLCSTFVESVVMFTDASAAPLRCSSAGSLLWRGGPGGVRRGGPGGGGLHLLCYGHMHTSRPEPAEGEHERFENGAGSYPADHSVGIHLVGSVAVVRRGGGHQPGEGLAAREQLARG
jgi:hypothetical protein